MDSIIGSVGYDRLIELGVRPGNVDQIDPIVTMTDEEKAAYVDGLGTCTSLRDLVVQSLGVAPPLDQCIDDAIPDEATARVVLISLLAGNDTGEPPTGEVAEVLTRSRSARASWSRVPPATDPWPPILGPSASS